MTGPKLATRMYYVALDGYKTSLHLPAEDRARRLEWARDFHVGDLVIELSSQNAEADETESRIGYVRAVRASIDAADGDVDVKLECFDGTVVEWKNAEFVRVPEALHEVHDAQGVPWKRKRRGKR